MKHPSPRGPGRLAWAAALLAAAGIQAAADLIVLQDGHEYDGVLVRATPKSIVFRQAGKDHVYPRSRVVHIRLQKHRQWDEFSRAADIPDPVLQKCLARRISPRDYPGAGIVTLYRRVQIRLLSAGRWSKRTRAVIRILSEHGEDASVRTVVYRRDLERARILHGLTIRPDGRVLHLQDTAIQNEAVYPSDARYNRVRRLRFALPEGKPGVVLDAATETERLHPEPLHRFAADFLFGGPDPALDTVVEIFVPHGLPFHWKLLNDPDGRVTHTQKKEQGGIRHVWTRLRSPQMLPEPMMPPWSDVVPRLVAAVGAADWTALAQEYQRALDRIQHRLPPPPPPPAQTPQALWRQVSNQVGGLGVSLFASGRLPRSPAETWKLRSGAPIDRTYLLYRWLQAAGIPDVRWVWIRPRSAGRLARSTPTLSAFSVPAVALWPRSGPPHILVPADELAGWDEPAAGALAGAPCLVAGLGLRTVPAVAPERFGTDRNVTVRLDRRGTARVLDRITFRGAAARSLRAWRRLTAADIRNRVMGMVRSVDARAANIRWKILGDVRKCAPTIGLELRYEIPEFADVRRALCALRPPWLAESAELVGRDTRRFPLFWSRPYLESIQLQIQGPPGYALYALPTPVRCRKTGPVRIETTVQRQRNTGLVRLSQARAVTEAPAAVYPALKHCLQARAALGRQYWVWRRPRK